MKRNRMGTEPSIPARGADVGEGRRQEHGDEPHPVRRLHLFGDAGKVGELRQQEVGDRDERDDRDDRAARHTSKRHELGFVDVAPLRDGRLQLLEQPLLLPQRDPRRAAQRVHLEQAQRRAHGVGSEDGECSVDRALGADIDRERGEQLRDVAIEERVVDRDIAETEIDEPRRARLVDHDVPSPEVAVGDSVGAQDRDLFPDRAQERVVDGLTRIDLVERLTVDEVVGHEHRIGADLRDRAHPRSAHADVTGLQRRQCFVLHVAAQRPERALVTHVLQPERSEGPVEHVSRTFLGAQHLAVELRAVGAGGHVGARPAAVGLHRLQRDDRQGRGGEAGDDGGVGRVLIRTSERHQHGCAHRAAEREGEEDLGGELHRERDAKERERRDHHRAGAPPPLAHERGQDHERRGEPGQTRRRDHAAELEAGARGEVVRHVLGLPVFEPCECDADERSRRDVGDDQVAQESVPLQHDRHDEHPDADHHREHLGGTGQHALGRRVEEVQECEHVGFEAEDCVLTPARQRQHRDR